MRADWKGSVEVEAWWMNWPPSVSESNFFFRCFQLNMKNSQMLWTYSGPSIPETPRFQR